MKGGRTRRCCGTEPWGTSLYAVHVVVLTFSVLKIVYKKKQQRKLLLIFPGPSSNSKQAMKRNYGTHFPSAAENVDVGSLLHLLLRQSNGLHPVLHQPFVP